MIANLALAVVLQSANPVSEFPDPGSGIVSVQAVVKLPQLTAREYAETGILAETMSDEVEGYNRAEMRNMAAAAGESLRISLMPDHLRIQIGVPAGQMKAAVGYIDQILHNSRLSDDSLKRAMNSIPFVNRSFWGTALQPFRFEFPRVRREDVLDLYHRICRPENVWLAVGGAIEPGAADDYWRSKVDAWKPDRAPRPSIDMAKLPSVESFAGRESMIELRGKEIIGSDPSLSTQILAVIALGSGKGSAMFERLREAKGWSYRQEAVLWPSAGGFVPRLMMASGEKSPPADLAKGMKEQLVAAVNGWTDADVARARGMAEGILMRGIPMSPLYFDATGPVGESLDDETFMSAYWRMKTGREWNPKKLLGEMALVALPDLKEAASAILNGSEAHVIPATGV